MAFKDKDDILDQIYEEQIIMQKKVPITTSRGPKSIKHYKSYSNSFWGDVVLDAFNNASRDEEKFLYQIYIKQICPDFFIMMIFDFIT